MSSTITFTAVLTAAIATIAAIAVLAIGHIRRLRDLDRAMSDCEDRCQDGDA